MLLIYTSYQISLKVKEERSKSGCRYFQSEEKEEKTRIQIPSCPNPFPVMIEDVSTW
jgi:hypothetical protein